jgi:hypothetical protein
MTYPKKCPRCGGDLLWNGRGYACIACTYFSATPAPPSERKLAVQKSRMPGKK